MVLEWDELVGQLIVPDKKRNKIHIGYHKTGTTFLQKHIFPDVKNYQGRIYSSSGDGKNHSFKKLHGGRSEKTCENIIRKFSNERGIFISDETFSKIRHEQLFQILDDKWDVLVVTRHLPDLVRSRKNHRCRGFFLYDKIKRASPTSEIDQEIRDFYNPKKLLAGITNLTILSYEKLFSGDNEELARLSMFLGHDASELFNKKSHMKTNKSRRKA